MDEDEQIEDSAALGFRQPPNDITKPCLVYMGRVMELRDFIAYFFGFVKASSQLRKLIPEASHVEAGEGGFRLIRYSFSRHRPLVNQVMLTRAVETFDLYLTTILRDIFLAKPEMLKSEQQIDVATVIDAGSYDEVILKIVERKVHDLGYQSIMNLRRYVAKATGVDLFESEAAYETVLIASEVRNLIAHNNCVPNAIFAARTKGVVTDLKCTEDGKIDITDEWLRKASYTLDAAVFNFDSMVSTKFKLTTVPWRSHDASSNP